MPPAVRPGLAHLADGASAAGPRTLRQVATVNHQGTVVAFAREPESGAIHYDVLDLHVSAETDDQQWTGYSALSFPNELRPAGLDLVTVGDRKGEPLGTADVPPQAVSDGRYVCLYQQSARDTLLLNRFMLKRLVPPQGGDPVPVLEPVWEVRFSRSGRKDVPDGPRDVQTYLAPDGSPFIEPTIELPIRDIDSGRFAALLLPDEEGAVGTWQFFAVNARTGRLDLFSFPADADGLFDLTEAKLDPDGNVEPTVSVALSLETNLAIEPLTLAGVPSATLYTLRERVHSSAGDELLLKRAARVLVSQPVRRAGRSDPEVATLDFGLSKEGRLATIEPDTVTTLVSPADYGLRFTTSAHLELPDSATLGLRGSFSTEFWLYLSNSPGALGADQYVLRGDPSLPPAQAAPYVKVTGDLRVEVGFGTGTESVAARTRQPVVAPSVWAHIRVSYDTRADRENFTVFVNGDAVPLDGANAHAAPAGNPIAMIGSQHEGIVGVLDFVRLWDDSGAEPQLVGDWELDIVDYDVSPPTTPDSSPAGNTAIVHGASLVPSTAPVSMDTAGRLQIDEEGLTVYAGLLDFARPAGSPSLTTGSDGLVHMYYEGRPTSGDRGLFTVAQFDAETARAVYQVDWSSVAPHSTEDGQLQLVAARSGGFMNQCSIVVGPSEEVDLCTVEMDDHLGRQETWSGVPRAVEAFSAVLNGTSTGDLSDPEFRAGRRVFYDHSGTYAMSRLTVSGQDEDVRFTLLSRFPTLLQLSEARIEGVTEQNCTLALAFEVPSWGHTAVTQRWPDLPVFASDALTVLAGTSDTYDYRNTASSDVDVHVLSAYDPSGGVHDILVLGRPGLHDLQIGISPGATPELCDVSVQFVDGGRTHTTELSGVPRDQNLFAQAVDSSALAGYLVLLTDGLTASVRDRAFDALDLADMRAWSRIAVAFADPRLAATGRLVTQSVPAAVRQRSTVRVNGVDAPLAGASTMFRCAPAARPSNGGVAMVLDTAGLTNGTANLAVAAVNGGWLRRPPDFAIALDGGNAVVWDVAGPNAEALAIAGDLTVEGWCRSGPLGADTDLPRLLTYHRVGTVDFPDLPVRFALGLHPAPSLRFGPSTALYGTFTLEATDLSAQISLIPEGERGSGQVLEVRSVGVVHPYVALSVGPDQRVTANYGNGTVRVVGSTPLPPDAWTQLTVTLAVEDPDTARLRLYVNGELDAEATGPRAVVTNRIGGLRVGSVEAAFPMRANGVFLWHRALEPRDVALGYTEPVLPNDPGLLIAWYLTEGSGSTISNQAVGGVPTTSTIFNEPTHPWSGHGIYALPFATHGDFGLVSTGTPMLGGWRHVGATYRSAFALRLPGDQYADCGNSRSLDTDRELAVEAWYTPERLAVRQALVSKPGAFELAIDYRSRIEFTVWTSAGEIRVAGPAPVERGRPYYLAAVASGGAVEVDSPSKDPTEPRYFLSVQLFVDGELRGEFRKDDYTKSVSLSTSAERLNLGRNPKGAAYLTGSLSDVRLWNRTLPAEQVAQTFRTHRVGSTDGLVSYWRFAESQGKVAYDSNDLNNAILTSNTLWTIYPPASVLTMVVDGQAQDGAQVVDPAALGGYGDEQFTVGACQAGGVLTRGYSGELNDLRIWQVERTAEQVREDMYRELAGDEPGLAGYWTFDTGSGLAADDATGNQNNGTLVPAVDPPRWTPSRAPISNEARQVHNALGGFHTVFAVEISGTPSVVEYADTRRDAYGGLFSVMKRSYAADRPAGGGVEVFTGYKVGDLDMVYAGQVQTQPSLIGYIEGAPPIPSENQTNPWWDNVNMINRYADNSKVRLTHGENTVHTFRSSEKTENTMNFGLKAGLKGEVELGVGVGIGAETHWKTLTAELKLGLSAETKLARGSERELEFGFGTKKTSADEVSAAGEWEPADTVLNPEVGRRYVPENFGYALVKSLTADLYLLTLRGSATVVRMVLVPSTDIPEDVNIISFPIDPHYVKNGTLDGMVGFRQDPDFPYANLSRSSYFRPIEAYSLKRSIERQTQQLAAYYRQFDTANASHGPALVLPGAVFGDTGFTEFADTTLPEEPSYDWKRRLAKRSLVNTYVWTSHGGLHTEQSELVDTYSESYSGISSWESSAGLNLEVSLAVPLGPSLEFDATYNTAVEVTAVRRAESESSFGLDVEFAPDAYLKRPVVDVDGRPVGYTEQDAPGKVTGYRFMSFLLAPDSRNFTDFQRVVDQHWLQTSADPDAAALRTATAATNGTWRVLHRVTYVSRVPPSLQPTPAESAAPDITPPAGLAGNTVLTRMIERHIDTPAPTPTQIGQAAEAVLGRSPEQPGLLAEVLPWWVAFLAAAQDRRSEAYRTLTALRPDLVDYMIQKYAAAAAEAGGELVARLRSTNR